MKNSFDRILALYTEDDLVEAKYNDLLSIQCKYCSKPFLRTKAYIVQCCSPSKEKRRRTGYCSRRCAASASSPLIKINCVQCNKETLIRPSQYSRSKSGNHFCSRECAGLWNSTHKKHGTRSSKLEQWLAQRLVALYPKLDFHFNKKTLSIVNWISIYQQSNWLSN